MARTNSIDAEIARRIRDGRGMGEGAAYRPWITIRDISSMGQSHRVPGRKTCRMHHLLSNLERAVFLISEWPDRTLDLREQFPLLPIEETLAIASRLGIKHPAHPSTGEPVVMTTDLVLTVRGSFSTALHPINVKYSAELARKRTQEKIEIESLYWKIRACALSIVTEKEIPKPLLKNLEWITGCWDLGDGPGSDQAAHIAEFLAKYIIQDPHVPLTRICLAADQKISLTYGSCLNIARHALARKWWRVPLNARINSREPLNGLVIDPRAPWRKSPNLETA
jgi:hypothetical protein